MHGSVKIQSTHLERPGVVYLRQSDPKQVRENRESAVNQRALKERLLELGWKASQVSIVDGDQGTSARQMAGRESFQKLAADAGLGRIGIIMGYEVSRLARNCADWHRLLELCALTDTLIGDADGVYNPRDFNDRLLLGLKGTMSEAELHSLRLRLNAGRLSKARRGELVHHLPTGYVRLETNEVKFDPDESVTTRIKLVFTKFKELGTGRRVLRYLATNQLMLPRRQTSGLHAGETLWKQPTLSVVHSILKNPAYAGAFAYGRRQTVGSRQTPGRPATGRIRQGQKSWTALVKDVYPAYINWDEWEQIQQKIRENHRVMQNQMKPRGHARQGAAMLAGLVRCGKCGHAMRVVYKQNRFQYKCSKGKSELNQTSCQFLSGSRIDDAVLTAYFDAIRPANIDALQAASRLQVAQHQDQLKHLRQDVERLNFTAHRAERQYNKVDPENRLIAATLERRWESAMEELEQSRFKLKEAESVPPVTAKISAAHRKLFADAGKQMSELWSRLSLDSRKQLLRTLICGINLNRGDAGCVKIRIVWRGGLVTEVERQVPIMSQKYSSLEKLVTQRIQELSSAGQTLDEIAVSLNQEGFVPCRGGHFTAIIVSKLKHQYGIVSGLEQIRRGTRPKGTYTTAEVAVQLGVQRSWIYRKISSGEIRIDKNEAFGCYLFPKSKQTINDLKQLKLGKCAHVSIQKVHHES